MTQTSIPANTFYTNPNTGGGIPCTVISADDDGLYEIEIIVEGVTTRGVVSAGELYREDESGRYLGGPA